MSAHRNILRTFFVPALTAAVIGAWAGAGLYIPSSSGIATRSDEVALAASIDTASDAVGVSESSLYFMDQSDLNTAMDALQSMGVTQIRVLLPWEFMEPTDGTYSWTQTDQLLDTAAKYNIAVDATVVSTPPWASVYSQGGTIPDAAPNASAYADYASFLSDLASRYTSKISSIEVWNEPNGYNGWYPTPDPAGYTELLKDAYTAIKAADPDITVVGGVLGAGKTIGTLTINPVDFLQQMYADGAEGYFDALSFHPYNYTATFSQGTLFADSAIKQLQAMRDLMNSNGDAAKLIWATEYGEPSTTAGGQAQQAAYIQDFLTTWSSLSGVGPMFLYNLIDSDTGTSTAEDNLGLFTDDWTAKAAVSVVEAWLAAHPTAVATDPPAVSLVSAVAAAAQTMVADAANMMSNAASTMQHMISGVATALANMVKALTSTMSSAATAVVNTVSHAAASVAAAVTPKTTSVASMTTSPARTAILSGATTTATRASVKTVGASADLRPAASASTTNAGTTASSRTASGDANPATTPSTSTKSGDAGKKGDKKSSSASHATSHPMSAQSHTKTRPSHNTASRTGQHSH